jgi:long-chain fatty acid transport protein
MISMGVAAILASPAYATNGMSLEGYGAKSAAMGGTSMAYDIGNSGMMGNPATLGLRKEGNNFGIGVTVLQPDINASIPAFGLSSDSEATSFLMPSLSFIRKDGDFTYGVGVFAQGGMGTEYPGTSFLAMNSGLPQMSQVGFGRVMFPLAYQATKELSIAAQIDYVWASMDLQRLVPPNPMAPMGGYVSVKDDSDFTGQMTGSGFALKLGAVYQFNNEFSVGATYHSETSLDDLTGSGTFTAFTPMGPASLPANYTVNDFQWPATFGIGMAWNVTPELLVAADIKQLMWSQTLSDFSLTTEIPGFGGGTGVERQDWSDQTVFAIGAQYKIDPAVALRIGYNYGANPVPDDTINYLFPAITEQHFSFGVGWQIDKANSLSAAFTYAPEVTQTAVAPNQLAPLEISHSQTLWRLNYAYSF